MRRLACATAILWAVFVVAGATAFAHKAQIDTSVSLTAPTGSATTFTEP